MNLIQVLSNPGAILPRALPSGLPSGLPSALPAPENSAGGEIRDAKTKVSWDGGEAWYNGEARHAGELKSNAEEGHGEEEHAEDNVRHDNMLVCLTGAKSYCHEHKRQGWWQRTSRQSRLGFLSLSHSRKDCDKFTHGYVDDYYSALVPARPCTHFADATLDEIDNIFVSMVDAGAVQARKHLVTNYEHLYLEKLRKWFSQDYHIYCQVSVGSALMIDSEVSSLPQIKRLTFAQKCHNMSFDFILVNKANDQVVCAIELDDSSHLAEARQHRDRRLDLVCLAAQLPLFHITNINHKPNLSRLNQAA